MSDPIAAAIDATEGEEKKKYLINTITLESGLKMQISVPREQFGSDEFETAIGMLITLRYAVEQEKAQRASPIVTPEKPPLVGMDGKKLK